jgi:hypothetical protein
MLQLSFLEKWFSINVYQTLCGYWLDAYNIFIASNDSMLDLHVSTPKDHVARWNGFEFSYSCNS